MGLSRANHLKRMPAQAWHRRMLLCRVVSVNASQIYESWRHSGCRYVSADIARSHTSKLTVTEKRLQWVVRRVLEDEKCTWWFAPYVKCAAGILWQKVRGLCPRIIPNAVCFQHPAYNPTTLYASI